MLRFSDTVSEQIISALLEKEVEHVPQQTRTKSKQTLAESEQNDTLVIVIEMLKKELESKGNQLFKKDKQIDDLNDRLAHEKKLNEHNQILLKQEKNKNILLDLPSKKKTFLQRIIQRS